MQISFIHACNNVKLIFNTPQSLSNCFKIDRRFINVLELSIKCSRLDCEQNVTAINKFLFFYPFFLFYTWLFRFKHFYNCKCFIFGYFLVTKILQGIITKFMWQQHFTEAEADHEEEESQKKLETSKDRHRVEGGLRLGVKIKF